jgi:hypothetical protein
MFSKMGKWSLKAIEKLLGNRVHFTLHQHTGCIQIDFSLQTLMEKTWSPA